MRLSFIKTVGGLFAPYGEDSQKAMAKLKPGQLIGGDFAATRNYEFHKRYFALLGLLFEIWSESAPKEQYKGEDILPDFERFRKDVAIMAGHYRPVWALNGELRLEAESISFARMDETRFEELYSKTINVGLAKILKPGSMTEEQLRNRVDQLMEFDG